MAQKMMQPEEQTFATYVATVGRRKWIVVITIVIAVAAVLGLDATRTKMYSSEAMMQLISQNISPTNGYVVPLSTTDIATAVNVATSSQVRLIVAKRLGHVPPQASAQSLGGTAIVSVSVSTTNAAYSSRVANVYVRSYIEYTRQRFTQQILSQQLILQRQRTDLQLQILKLEDALASAEPNSSAANTLNIQLQNASSQIQTVNASLTQLQLAFSQVPSGAVSTSPSLPSLSPSSPKPLTDAVVAGTLGLLLGIALTLLLEFLDDRIRDREHLAQVTGGLPLIGEIPLFEGSKKTDEKRLISIAEGDSIAAEAYRSLRTSIQFVGFDSDDVQVIQITSPSESDGKTTTAANLAVTLATGGTRVAIIAGDLRKPSLHRAFNLDNSIGLSSFLSGSARLDEICIRLEAFPNLTVVASGPVPPNPSELLGSKRLGQMFDALREEVEIIIIDSPPVLPVTDSLVIAQVADAVIVIANSHKTHARDVAESLERLASINANVRGMVLNSIPPVGNKYRYRYRYGGYGRRIGYYSQNYGVAETPQPKRRFGGLKA